MNNKLISYCLFQPSIKLNRRDHDKNQYDKDRYYFNIPFLLYFWLQFNNDFDLIIYINKHVKNNKLYRLLLQSQLNYKNLTIKLIPDNFIGASPSIYRMQSVFRITGSYSTVFVKDVDSIPTVKELSVMDYFCNSDYFINNIRSVDSHNTNLCSLMAGLCGFKPFLLKKIINNYNFNNYIKSYKNNNWGCDQDLLIKYFTRPQLLKHFLQIRTSDSVNKLNNFYVNSLNINQIPEINIDLEIKSILEKISKWDGQPVDARQYKNIIPNSSKIYKIINKNQTLRQFYKI